MRACLPAVSVQAGNVYNGRRNNQPTFALQNINRPAAEYRRW
jgi:hypothetical protein